MNTSNLGKSAAIAVLLSTTVTASAALVDGKQLAVDLLQKGLVNADTSLIEASVAKDYIQHNPAAPDGLNGLLGFVDYLQTLDTPVTVSPVRVLQENDLVVVHSEYNMNGRKAVFDLFRIENGQLVEHWDAIQEIPTETASGRSMTDGPTDIEDLDKTSENKQLVTDFVTDVLVNGKGEKLTDYIGDTYHQHNPSVKDGVEGLGEFIAYLEKNDLSFSYQKIHNVVAEGNFVFTQSEGQFGEVPTAFYDLFRVENGLIVEHWDVVQEIPSTFAHSNGMF